MAREGYDEECWQEMKTALFLNGVYESVIEDIIASQFTRSGGTHYLQPYKGAIIQMLKKAPPSEDAPVSLYVSTTKNLKNICYTAEIVDWKDKRELSMEERDQVSEHLAKYQPGEKPLFSAEGEVGEKAVNLLTLRHVRRCVNLPPTSILRKRSDGLALKPRTRAGGWSEVFVSVSYAASIEAMGDRYTLGCPNDDPPNNGARC